MNKKLVLLIIIAVISFLIIGFILNYNNKHTKIEGELDNIRIGWQIPWATQGQLTQILKQTDILQEHNLSGEFKGFSHGAPLNEAALANEVDVIFTADQPAATLISVNDDWVIIGRLMYNRVSLYVPPNSPIKSVAELKDKTVGMPFGAAAQRMALKVQKDAGLDPEKDVNNVNLGIYEQSDLVRDPNAESWGNMDALAGFDPTPAIFEEKELIRNLEVGNVVSVIVMNKNYIDQNPDAPENFLRSFHEAYDFYRINTSQANTWFISESKLDVSEGALGIAASVEPNLKAKSKEEIRLGFTDNDYLVLQEAADFIFDQSLIKTNVIMKDHIDLSFLESANLN